jgi:hypothetical protein
MVTVRIAGFGGRLPARIGVEHVERTGAQLLAAGLRGVVISATDLTTRRWLRAVSAWEGSA